MDYNFFESLNNNYNINDLMDDRSGIYCISLNDKIYIGSSKNFKNRKKDHLKRLNAKKHHSWILQKEFCKQNGVGLNFYVLEWVEDVKKLIEREQFWLDFLKPEYNISKKAYSCLGVKRTKEQKERQSQSSKGRVFTEEHKKNISNALKNKIVSKETRIKIGISSKGRRHTNETKEKIRKANTGKVLDRDLVKRQSEGRKGFKHTEETKKRMRDIKIGKKHTKESLLKMSLSQKGRTHSQETKDKISASNKGKRKHSDEARAMMSITRKGRKASDETRKKQSLSRKGRVISEYSLKKMLDGQRKYWEQIRQEQRTLIF